MNDSLFVKKNINLYRNCSDAIVFVHHRSIGADYPLHLNSYYEIYILAEGVAEYIVEGSCYHLSAGDVVIISPYEVHKPCVGENAPYERFYFLVPPDAFDYMEESPLGALADMHGDTGNLLSPPSEEKQKILSFLREISNRDGADLSASLDDYTAFIGILSILNRCRPAIDKQEPAESLPLLLSDILVYIDQNLTAIDSVSELARHFGVSAPYLSALFKKKLGSGISSYIRARKIGHAKKLLDRGQDVTSVCFDSGFNDCSYFTKVFKTYVGMTPQRYKQSEK